MKTDSTPFITLQAPDPKTSALLGKNKGIRPGDLIRPSQFAVIYDYGSRRILYNTFTCHCIETDRLAWFEEKKAFPFDPDDAVMAALVQADFLVAAHIDEAERYGAILQILRKMHREKPGYTSYTILPTTACNARCFYCYEAGITYETMTEETVQQVIRYIHATRRQDAPVMFDWFGGEPLVGDAIIDEICAAMRRDGVNYTSGIITNGSLMTEEMAEKAVKDWHLKKAQITLDGREEVYCERKRYVSFESSPYRAVLNGIHALLKRGVRVNIRVNVDEENMAEMYALADELESEFAEKKGIFIYAHCINPVSKTQETGDNDALYDDLGKLNARLRAFNRGRGDGRDAPHERDDSHDAPHGRTKLHYCMADNPVGNPVIAPGGELYICEHISEASVAGHISDEKPIDHAPFIEQKNLENGRCRRCPMLPACTDYSSCPVIYRDCFREMFEAEKSKFAWTAEDQ